MKIKSTFKRLFFRIINPTFFFSPNEGLNSLILKINIYFFFYKKEKLKYIKEIDFLNNIIHQNNSLSYVFPYEFSLNFDPSSISVYLDSDKQMFYVYHNKKKLFYPKSYLSKKQVSVNYLCTLIEQNKASPHRYLSQDFDVNNGDVVLDIGAAEGNFALDVVEKASKVYIFEPDPKWKEALESTFEPWAHKVSIITKYVSDIDNIDTITLDAYFKDVSVNFIKIDAEGYEFKILKKANNLLKFSKFPKLLVCTYHNNSDAHQISYFLSCLGFNISFTNGYMLFIHKNLSPPYFRHGILKANR
ncbi:FkbM family methyltransferase [Larkinella punicea]|uniref:Methyltransferase FkbM domain-containing protein n=1 Tax=Larkinella punicea TaxID=2315727 RepID=A0A368JIZ1_9BACT|nr:FkbM family methyltransferase [Larkinella punicea]RCR67618.1 hypothetical protein DUE52_21180 [Larkinella punicea]